MRPCRAPQGCTATRLARSAQSSHSSRSSSAATQRRIRPFRHTAASTTYASIIGSKADHPTEGTGPKSNVLHLLRHCFSECWLGYAPADEGGSDIKTENVIHRHPLSSRPPVPYCPFVIESRETGQRLPRPRPPRARRTRENLSQRPSRRRQGQAWTGSA